MFIWGVFAVLTALAAIAVLWPYARARRVEAEAGGSDAEVYKDQLREIDQDLGRGVLSEAEAESARIEISRRLLKASDLDDAAQQAASKGGRLRAGFVLMTAFLVVPLLAIALYVSFGAPGLPDRPLADRLAADVQEQDAAILIARVEQAVADDPNDVRGWSILAPIYARQGRFFEARRAYEQLSRLLGDEPALLTDWGEVIVIENQGLVTEEAMGHFLAALDADPSFAKARYYRALGLIQDGQTEEARAILIALRNDGGPDAPWTESVTALLDNMEGAAAISERVSAPDEQSAQAIAALPEAERRQAIEGMVAGLAARLEDQPDDLAGWSQLIRSYVTLGQREEAQRSLLTALDFFETDNPARLRLLTIAEELQLQTTP